MYSQYIPTYPQYAQYILRVWRVLRPSVHRPDKFSGPLFGTKHSLTVPRVGVEANYFRWGQLEYLQQWQYFEMLCTARNSVSILRVHTCLRSRGSGLLILSLLSAFGPSQYSQYFGRQYSNTLSNRTTICSRAFICETFTRYQVCFTLSTKEHFLGGSIYCICCTLLSLIIYFGGP